VDAAVYEVSAARAFSRPTVSGLSGVNTVSTPGLTPEGLAPREGVRPIVGLELTHSLYSFGRERARQQESQAALSEAESAAGATRLQLLADAGRDFVALLELNGATTIHADQVSMLDELLGVYEEQAAVDMRSDTEVQLVRSRRETAVARLALTQADYAALLRQVAERYGVSAETLDAGSLLTLLDGLPIDLDAALEMGLANSPAVDAALAEEERRKARADFDRAELRPSIELRASTSRGLVDEETAGSDELGVYFNMPLFDGGRRRALSRASDNRSEAAELSRGHVQRLLRERVAGEWELMTGSRDALDAWNRALEAELRSLEGVSQEVQSGLRSTIDLLEARDQTVAVELSRLRAEYDYWRSVIALLETIGADFH
jgi:outer membrane protein